MKKFYLFVIAIVAVITVFVSWEGARFVFSSASEDSVPVTFEVQPGASFHQIAEKLVEQGLVTNRLYFKILSRVLNYSGRMQVGEYSLRATMSPLEILQILSSGKSIQYAITFQEGLNMYEMAQLIENQGRGSQKEFLRLCRDQTLIKELLGESRPSLEGYLYPNTYYLARHTALETLVRNMVKGALSAYEKAAEGAAIKMPRHSAIILASIIEKETGAAHERPLIASVFHNRLKKGMRLQSDPTIIYGMLHSTGVMPKNIKKRDIMAYTKFNTYRVKALPFGPIANPGGEAMRAAHNPTPSDYLYFVSRNDGTHVFSESYEQHNKAVRKFQLDRRMREGRSWRDLRQ